MWTRPSAPPRGPSDPLPPPDPAARALARPRPATAPALPPQPSDLPSRRPRGWLRGSPPAGSFAAASRASDGNDVRCNVHATQTEALPTA
eukprot:6700273-Pyramimonas_sp.AAC.1